MKKKRRKSEEKREKRERKRDAEKGERRRKMATSARRGALFCARETLRRGEYCVCSSSSISSSFTSSSSWISMSWIGGNDDTNTLQAAPVHRQQRALYRTRVTPTAPPPAAKKHGNGTNGYKGMDFLKRACGSIPFPFSSLSLLERERGSIGAPRNWSSSSRKYFCPVFSVSHEEDVSLTRTFYILFFVACVFFHACVFLYGNGKPISALFIQVQKTPNPLSLMFIPGREVLPVRRKL